MAILEKKFDSILSKLHLVKINYFLFNSLKFLCDCRSIPLQLLSFQKLTKIILERLMPFIIHKVNVRLKIRQNDHENRKL